MSGAWSTPVRSSSPASATPPGSSSHWNGPCAAPLPRDSGWTPRERSTSCAGARPCWRRAASVCWCLPGGAAPKPALDCALASRRPPTRRAGAR
jgi:hypothetical protein